MDKFGLIERDPEMDFSACIFHKICTHGKLNFMILVKLNEFFFLFNKIQNVLSQSATNAVIDR